MLGLIISILIFGTDITAQLQMLTYDCDRHWQEQFTNIEDCYTLKEFAWLWFKYFMAMNILGSLDIGGYLILLNYASNPFVERNKTFVVMLSDKCHFRVLPPTVKNAFVYKRGFYYLREPFVDPKTNNKYHIYYEGISEPIHDITLSKPKITTMLATTHLDLKLKRFRQFLKMFKISYWRRHYIMVLKPDMTVEIYQGKGQGIPYRFGLFRNLYLNLQKKDDKNEGEHELAVAEGKLATTTATTTVLIPTTIAVDKVPNALNANFNYMVYKDYIDIYKKLSGKDFPTWLFILAGIVIVAIIIMYFTGMLPSQPQPQLQPKPPTEGLSTEVIIDANGTE